MALVGYWPEPGRRREIKNRPRTICWPAVMFLTEAGWTGARIGAAVGICHTSVSRIRREWRA